MTRKENLGFVVWSGLAVLMAIGLYPGEPSSDYIFQKREALGELTTWHPVFLAILIKAFKALNVENVEPILFFFQVVLFYVALYVALKGVAKSYGQQLAALLLVFLFFPFWFFLKTLWKDAFFVSFYVLSCAMLFRLSKEKNSRALILFLVFAALAQLTRHNAFVSISLSAVFFYFYYSDSRLTVASLARATVYLLVFVSSMFAIKNTAEYLVNAKSPGSMTNFVIVFDNFGALSKLDMHEREQLLEGFDPSYSAVATKGIDRYRHTAPSDYLYWGRNPILGISEELESKRNIELYKYLLVKNPISILDFKADILLQLLGVTRYDFRWEPVMQREEWKSPLLSIMNVMSDRINSSEADIYGEANLVNFWNYLYGGLLVSSFLLLLLFFLNPSSPNLKLSITWIAFGIGSVLPYLLLTPGAFYRYEAAAQACFCISWGISMIGAFQEISSKRAEATLKKL